MKQGFPKPMNKTILNEFQGIIEMMIRQTNDSTFYENFFPS